MSRGPRPEGTDGSDFQFRERVENEYKSLPVWRAAGWLLLHFASIAVFAKAAWALAPYYIDGTMPHPSAAIILMLYLAALTLWTLAKPATYREDFGLVKATAAVLLLLQAVHMTMMFKTHVVDAKQALLPRRLWKHMQDEKGWTDERWLTAFNTLEAIIESGVFLLAGGAGYCIHIYVKEKMHMNKRLKRTTAASAQSEAPAAIAPAKGGKTGPVRRRA